MGCQNTVLIVDDDERLLEMMEEMLSGKNLRILTTSDSLEAFELYLTEKPCVVFCDYVMPNMNGIEIMQKILQHNPQVAVVIFTGAGTVTNAVEAMKKGAYDYITKPMDIAKMSVLIDRILETQAIRQEKEVLQQQLDQLYGFENFVGNSEQIQHVFQQIQRVASSDSTVLISGESGTGKELVANAIHYSSSRKGKSFIKVNCAALSENLIESELFGHEKGAFTSAISKRIGRFELANNGTLFLDEIGDIPPSTQIKLLRVLEAKEFERLGGNDTIKVDVRLLTATNKNLHKAVKDGTFREDLYFRLNVINIHIAPLRERPSDISLLVHYFLEKYTSQMNKRIHRISNNAMLILESYNWPGNVRELENAIERAVVYCQGNVLTEEDLPPNIKAEAEGVKLTLNLPSYSLYGAEKLLIEKVVKQSNWNLKQAAATLGISRGTLYSKLDKYKIKKPK
ncbi:sigma-54-dependent Fis family transcriptional regulator [candidate division KSB1 bacterium]|nr:sigma-54-dependent Fis family transcriptional regulator [candidate division KSB1 bacterium]